MNDCLPTIQSQIAHGDQKAFARLHVMYYRKLCHFAHSLLRSRESSEEIVEDVFVKLWTNREQITSIKNLTVYLYVAVKNASLNLLSGRARELVTAPFDFLETDGMGNTPDPHELMITTEMLERMQQAVNALPPRCRMIFRLVREDGLQYREVAEILNISINTIDAQMAIAVKRICQSLELKKQRRPVFRFSLKK